MAPIIGSSSLYNHPLRTITKPLRICFEDTSLHTRLCEVDEPNPKGHTTSHIMYQVLCYAIELLLRLDVICGTYKESVSPRCTEEEE